MSSADRTTNVSYRTYAQKIKRRVPDALKKRLGRPRKIHLVETSTTEAERMAYLERIRLDTEPKSPSENITVAYTYAGRPYSKYAAAWLITHMFLAGQEFTNLLAELCYIEHCNRFGDPVCVRNESTRAIFADAVMLLRNEGLVKKDGFGVYKRC